MKIKSKQSGMTMMELLAVLVIIGIVGGVISAKFLGQAEEAKRKAARSRSARSARLWTCSSWRWVAIRTLPKACRR